MKKYLILLSLAFFVLPMYAQEDVIFEEKFDNNDRQWRLHSDQRDVMQIRGGRLQWKHEVPKSTSAFQYINRLDERLDFSVEVTFKLTRFNSEYGIYWGGIDDANANYFIVANKKFKVLRVRDGKILRAIEYQKTIYTRNDVNILRVERVGDDVNYVINDNVIYTEPYMGLLGKTFGMTMLGKSGAELDNLLIKGKSLPISLPDDMFYLEQPQNLGVNINSPFEELTPIIAPDGRGLYFSRREHPDNVGGAYDLQDIYYASMVGDNWGKAINMGKPWNNGGPNAVCSVTPDGNTVLLMNTYRPDGSQGGMGLSISQRTSTGWTVPQEVRISNYYNTSGFNEYFLTNDGKAIIMALQRDDTKGGRDLYVSFSEAEGLWSVPMNLGADINTSGIELSPFMASDGVTMYFASSGHPGYGKSDIFMTKRLDDSWQKWSSPKNLGQPVNSEGVDAYYSVPAAGDYAYFISEKDAMGKNDIFKIKLPAAVKPNPVVLVKGTVKNQKTGNPIATMITYHDLDSDEEVGIATSDPITGDYEIVLPLNRKYSYYAQKDGMYSVRDHIDLTNLDNVEYQEVLTDLVLAPIEIGLNVQLKNVFFVQSQAKLIYTSYPELNKLVEVLVTNPSIEIEISGHTDNVGDAHKNFLLSEQRVDAVKTYLISKGVASLRITGQGYGESKPIADNTQETTRRMNRRVEFKIISF